MLLLDVRLRDRVTLGGEGSDGFGIERGERSGEIGRLRGAYLVVEVKSA